MNTRARSKSKQPTVPQKVIDQVNELFEPTGQKRTFTAEETSAAINGLLEPPPKKQQQQQNNPLVELKKKEKASSKRILGKAIEATQKSVVENRQKDQIEAQACVNKLKELDQQPPKEKEEEEDFFDSYNPDLVATTNQISDLDEIKLKAQEEADKKFKYKVEKIEGYTERALVAIEKAKAAAIRNDEAISLCLKTIDGIEYGTRVGKHLIKSSVEKYRDNLIQHKFFVHGQERTIHLLRKQFGLPNLEDPNLQPRSPLKNGQKNTLQEGTSKQ